MAILPIQDDAELQEFFGRTPIRSAYQLGDLDERYSPYCRWFGNREGGELTHVVLVYRGLSVPAVLVQGPESGTREVLEALRAEIPKSCFIQASLEHQNDVEAVLGEGDWRSMVRMGLKREEFVPASGTEFVEPITHADTAALMSLYRYYPDHFFEPYQLESGLYYGIWEDGKLVSAAGVHVVSERFNIVALGNIVTHPDYRGRGLAVACTSTILEAAFSRVSIAALSTASTNLSAIQAFRKVGFNDHCGFFEGPLEVQ